MFRSKAFFSLLVMLVLAGFTAGCGTTEPAPIPPENKTLGTDASGMPTAPGLPAPSGDASAATAEGGAVSPAAGGEVIDATTVTPAAPAAAPAAPAAPADAAAPAAAAAPADAAAPAGN